MSHFSAWQIVTQISRRRTTTPELAFVESRNESLESTPRGTQRANGRLVPRTAARSVPRSRPIRTLISCNACVGDAAGPDDSLSAKLPSGWRYVDRQTTTLAVFEREFSARVILRYLQHFSLPSLSLPSCLSPVALVALRRLGPARYARPRLDTDSISTLTCRPARRGKTLRDPDVEHTPLGCGAIFRTSVKGYASRQTTPTLDRCAPP